MEMMENILVFLIEIREIFRHHLLFSLGILLVCCFIFGKLAEKIRLPAVTGYVIAGLLLGETFLGIVPNVYKQKLLEVEKQEELIEIENNNNNEHIEHLGHNGHKKKHPLDNITQIALGLIAISIGGEFNIKKLKKIGKEVFIVTITQLFLSFGLVALFLWIFGFNIMFALLLGAIASATTPAATVAIIQSLKAKGHFVEHFLYGIVIDDAGAVILFGIMLSIATSIMGATIGASVSTMNVLSHFLIEVVFSILLGFILGYALHILLSKGQRKNITTNEQLLISLSILLLATAIALSLHLSPLLTNMILGATIINFSERNEKILNIIGHFAPPIYAIFFAIVGTELDITIFADLEILMFGGIFVIARALGKYLGVFFGGKMANVEKGTQKYLGFCLLPQAGVAIGLALMLQNSEVLTSTAESMEYVSKVISIVLFSVCVNEFLGPSISKYAITKGAEFSDDDDD